ncbi:glycosyltransferase family 4 protein [Halomonas maura]|uniref:glycosyltransferase family 4 protein n=1 Tax=Halomonas maura TaxID=117606 RepID=UPI0025B48275|nr:glycosyltransferase family 4 protein [Halomonas maura]MDN3555265.1 glycosyltransferase family 4 protein [Halomonas maura]
MNQEPGGTFLIIAGSPVSLVSFRGHLIAELIALGLTVHAAGPNLPPDSPVRAELERMGARVHEVFLNRTGISPLDDLRTLFGLVGLMRRIRPDYVLGYTIKPVIFGTLSAFLAGCPHRFALITGLGYAFSDHELGHRQRLIGGLVTGLYRQSLRFAHKVFFQNPDDQALFRRLGVLNGTTPSVVVNGSGVDVDHYAPRAPAGRPTFLLIARLLIDKGVREYAEAAYRLKAEFPEAHFMLVGMLDSNPRSIPPAELARWEADGVISYLGAMSDVREALGAASVFVLPSFYREGVPRTILEALAMGRPVITTDTPGCRETVADGVNGYLVPPRDVDRLAAAMRRFLERPELAISMGERARQAALTKYDVRQVNAVMLKEMGFSCSSDASM